MTEYTKRIVDQAYACGASILRAAGQRAMARRIMANRALTNVQYHHDRMNRLAEFAREKLRIIKNNLAIDQKRCDEAEWDVCIMAAARIEEKRVRAERLNIPFTYEMTTVMKVWMNSSDEIQRLEDWRLYRARVRNDTIELDNYQTALMHVQSKQDAIEQLISSARMGDDLEHIADELSIADSQPIDDLIGEMLKKAFHFKETVDESARETDLMKDQVGQVQDASKVAKPDVSKAEFEDMAKCVMRGLPQVPNHPVVISNSTSRVATLA